MLRDELAEFLGIGVDDVKQHEQFAFETMKEEWFNKESEANFYKTTLFYLFDLVQWEDSGERRNFSERIQHVFRKYNFKTAGDFGSGIGSDVIDMFAGGAEKIYMIDYPSHTNEFAKFRLKKRGLLGKCYFIPLKDDTLPLVNIPQKVDVISSIASLEHCPKATKSMEWLRKNAKNLLLRPDPSNHEGHPMHHEHIFSYLQKILDMKVGDVWEGMECQDRDGDPSLFRVV